MVARDLRRYWPLDPDVTFLSHGTYGACPWPVLHAQSEWRARMERQPVHFLLRELEGHLDMARARLGEFVHADPEDLAFLPNATTAVSTVLRSLELRPGDEILTTDHDYNACHNAIRATTEPAGAHAVTANVPFPLASGASGHDVVNAILERAGPRTRLAVISHVTSPTALIFPIERIVSELAERGIDTLVDGAHAPGMVPLDIGRIGAAFYAGNAHKWLCAPKGAGFLHVRRDRQGRVRPLVVSHGANSVRTDRSRFRLEFDWLGTHDPTPFLSIPASIDFIAALVPGGWPEAMEVNRQAALVGRQRLLEAVGQGPTAPESMVGSMAVIELPPDLPPESSNSPLDPLHLHLLEAHAIEAPVYAWPHATGPGAARRRLLRISVQLYNQPAEYERLAKVLAELSVTEAKRRSTAGTQTMSAHKGAT